MRLCLSIMPIAGRGVRPLLSRDRSLLPAATLGQVMESVGTIHRAECSERVVCHCLQVTESTLVQAVTTLDLRTVAEVRHCTGAGEGCTACHRRIKQYLEQSA
jgi:NAD(P)H-nitrite reductase large subunit